MTLKNTYTTNDRLTAGEFNAVVSAINAAATVAYVDAEISAIPLVPLSIDRVTGH